MKIEKLQVNTEQIAGDKEAIALLCGEGLGYDYINNQRSDSPAFVWEEVVFPNNNYERFKVKVPGTKLLLTAEQLEQQKGKTKVRFKNLRGRFYRTNNGEYALSCRADGVEVIP